MEKKDHFPESGKNEKYIRARIQEAKEEDLNFSSGRIFGSMCTEPLKIGEEVNSKFIEANLGNPGLCQGTKKLESEVHDAIGSILGADDLHTLSVGGGTEGNILALWWARTLTENKKVVLPKSAHFSFQKACHLLDMEPVYVDLDEEYKTDLDDLEEKINDQTAIVIGIAGTTELGQIDPIEEMADIAGDNFFHVDAAFGGLVIPFLNDIGYEMPNFDFEVEGIDSLTVDPHKMGMSPTPLGLIYSREDTPVKIDSPYLTGKEQKTIRGTRSSSSIPAFWTTLNYLGKEGFKKIVAECIENTDYLVERMKELGLEPIIDPVMNIASFRVNEPKRIVEEMSDKEWNLSRTVNPPGLRFVLMPHTDMTSIDLLLKEMEELL